MKPGSYPSVIKLQFILLLIASSGMVNAQILNKLGSKINTTVNKQQSAGRGDVPVTAGKDLVPTQSTQNENVDRASYRSKFDFIPGDEVYYLWDFSEVSVGDIPSGWQIDGSAEVVEVDGFPGHYMMINDHSAIIPENFDDLTEDLTIQFDLICTDPFAWGSNQLYFAFANTNPDVIPKGQQDHLGSVNNSVFWISFHPGSQSASANKGHGEYKMRSKSGITQGTFPAEAFTDSGNGRLAKISVWKQKRRVRVYVNENKVLDLPTVLPQDMVVNTFVWSAYSYYNDNKYFVGNIRIARGMPDSRKNMLQNGKYVTTGITFDVNSAVIKPESFGLLKDIASNLRSAAGSKITIVGHTDSDGDEQANLELSRKRAEAVKKSLVNDFGVDPSMLETGGKGESEPVAANDSPQNKAKNRRVEFLVSQL